MKETKALPNLVDGKLSINGSYIHYQQSGSGPPLVLVHGLMGSLADWQERVVPLLTHQFSVLTFDLRGHGESDMPSAGYTSADMAADMEELLTQLDVEKADVVGHSFGGTVALHFTALHPNRVQRLTISDSRLRPLQPTQKLKDWVYWPVWKSQLQQFGLTLDEEEELDFGILEILVPRSPSQREQQRREQWKTLLSSTTANTDLRDPSGLTIELIREISVPMQALYGELSPCLPTLSGLRENLPGLTSSILSGLGHFFPLTKPALFVERIKSFHATLPQASAEPDAAPESTIGSEEDQSL